MSKFYIFNLNQALFFIEHGLIPIEIGVRQGKVYHVFTRDERAEEVFTKWCNGR